MKKQLFILLCSMPALFIGCTAMPNDDTIFISGQYITIDESGHKIPFEHKVRCNMEVIYNSQVSYGQSTYRKTFPLYSEEDGSFEFEVKNVGSYVANLGSIYIDGDTLLYISDTTIICSKGKPQTDIFIPLTYVHTFNTTLTPSHIRPTDTITLSINHDALTLVEIGKPIIGDDNKLIFRNDGLLELNVLWRYEVAREQHITFTLENCNNLITDSAPSTHLFIRYTTMNYGAYQIGFYLYQR